MVFGNSRGSFPIERHSGFEDQLYLLFEKIHGPDFSSYGEDFENDTFKIMPYYWGDCTCGFDALPDHPFNHRDECYQTEYKKINDHCKAQGWSWNSEEERKLVSDLCAKFQYPFPHGCAVHCGCDYPERVQAWYTEKGYPDGHLDTCMYRQPNFLYKPTDFRIEWYKYPLRDSYMNQELGIGEFTIIIKKCIESLNSV